VPGRNFASAVEVVEIVMVSARSDFRDLCDLVCSGLSYIC
jgi:hypothetical protein